MTGGLSAVFRFFILIERAELIREDYWSSVGKEDVLRRNWDARGDEVWFMAASFYCCCYYSNSKRFLYSLTLRLLAKWQLTNSTFIDFGQSSVIHIEPRSCMKLGWTNRSFSTISSDCACPFPAAIDSPFLLVLENMTAFFGFLFFWFAGTSRRDEKLRSPIRCSEEPARESIWLESSSSRKKSICVLIRRTFESGVSNYSNWLCK